MTVEASHNAVPPRPGRSGRARALLLDPTGRESVDRVVRLAAQALRTPTALVGVPQFRRLQIASGIGIPEPWRRLGHLPLDATVCGEILRRGEPVTVEDAARHPLASQLKRLENFPRVSYCGVPIRIGGIAVAVLSVTDAEPRRWLDTEIRLLQDLAASLVREVDAVTASLDQLPDPKSGADPLPTGRGVVTLRPNPDAVAQRAAPHVAAQPAQRVVAKPAAQSVVPQPAQDVVPQPAAQSADFGAPAPAAAAVPAVGNGEAATGRQTAPAPPYFAPPRPEPEAERAPAEPQWAVASRPDAEPPATREPTGEDRYRRIFEDSATPLFVMSPEGRFIEVNRAFEQLLGRGRDRIVSRSLVELGADEEAVGRLLGPLHSDGSVHDAELTLRTADGRTVVCAVTATWQPGNGVAYHGTFRDVTAQKESEAELLRSALHDALTGLPNRLVFMDRLDRLLTHAQRRPDYRFAVIFLDLDNFKEVNDTHGHVFGDQLLIAAARRLEACLRQGDTVARIGGDEFAVLLDGLSDSTTITWVVERMQAELAEPFSVGSRSSQMTASIGIAITTGHYDNAADLLRDADQAMYRAKAAGRNAYVIFDAGMHERALLQRQLEHDLREALHHEQLALHYQPVVELSGGTVTGLEALVRWAHPERGILLPDQFIPVAEQTGLIIEIGWWVLREACRQLRAWQEDFPHAAFRLTMSVNLSTKQFVHPQLISKIDEILAETGLEPHHLRLDLTEAVVMSNVDMAARLMHSLRERGIQICIDDFGTGYSSIRQLREFPISMLKIDRSFVGRLGEGTESREIVQSIIAIGRSMSIDAVAEGVETPQQLEQLRRLGTRFAQGFLFSLPLEAKAASQLLGQAT